MLSSGWVPIPLNAHHQPPRRTPATLTRGNAPSGYCYHQGLHVEGSVEKGLEYLEKAAGHKHPGALYYLVSAASIFVCINLPIRP